MIHFNRLILQNHSSSRNNKRKASTPINYSKKHRRSGKNNFKRRFYEDEDCCDDESNDEYSSDEYSSDDEEKQNKQTLQNKQNIKNYKNLLFCIRDKNDNIIKVLTGVTNEKKENQKVVNENVKYGEHLLDEEERKINKVIKKYEKCFKTGTQEKINSEIEEINKETNWKIRVLNERYY